MFGFQWSKSLGRTGGCLSGSHWNWKGLQWNVFLTDGNVWLLLIYGIPQGIWYGKKKNKRTKRWFQQQHHLNEYVLGIGRPRWPTLPLCSYESWRWRCLILQDTDRRAVWAQEPCKVSYLHANMNILCGSRGDLSAGTFWVRGQGLKESIKKSERKSMNYVLKLKDYVLD